MTDLTAMLRVRVGDETPFEGRPPASRSPLRLVGATIGPGTVSGLADDRLAVVVLGTGLAAQPAGLGAFGLDGGGVVA